jgi:hypothetical protein
MDVTELTRTLLNTTQSADTFAVASALGSCNSPKVTSVQRGMYNFDLARKSLVSSCNKKARSGITFNEGPCQL